MTTSVIVNYYGSEMNGIFQTANHFVNMFTFVEGGFVVSAVVKLYAAVEKREFDLVNGLISSIKFFLGKVAIIFLVVSTIGVSVYLPFVKTSISSFDVAFIFGISIINSALTIYASYNNAIFEAYQDEYYLKLFYIFSNLLQIVITMICAKYKLSVLWIKGSMFLTSAMYWLCIIIVRKKRYPYIRFDEQKTQKMSILRDSIDVMVQKIASIINQSLDIFLLTLTGQVVLASVYGVINMVFNFAKVLGDNIAASPINGIGKLLNNGKKKEVEEIYSLYEFIVINVYIFLVVMCSTLIIPFVKLYIKGSDNSIYMNKTTIILFSIVVFFNVLNRPSSSLINYSGNFAFQRNVLCISTPVNLIISILLVKKFGINGILIGTLVSYLMLVPLNVYKASKNVLRNFSYITVYKYVISVILFLVMDVCGVILGTRIYANNYFVLIVCAILCSLLIGGCLVGLRLIFNRNEMKKTVRFMLKKIKKV